MDCKPYCNLTTEKKKRKLDHLGPAIVATNILVLPKKEAIVLLVQQKDMFV